MFPVLLDFGGDLKLHTYGVLMAVAFVVAIWLAGRRADKMGLDPNDVLDLAFWILVASMVGSRVVFIFTKWDEYAANPLELLKIWKGGLVFYGGFIGATLAAIWYCRKHGLPFLRVADVCIPTVSVAHAIGRLGCVAAGCCYGKPTDLPWALHFPPGSLAHYDMAEAIRDGRLHGFRDALDVGLHPVQLYESLGELAIFGVLVWMTPRRKFHGQLLALWLVLYAAFRASNEMFRGDVGRGFVIDGVLSTSQFISILMVACAAAVVVVGLRARARGDVPGAPPPPPPPVEPLPAAQG